MVHAAAPASQANGIACALVGVSGNRVSLKPTTPARSSNQPLSRSCPGFFLAVLNLALPETINFSWARVAAT